MATTEVKLTLGFDDDTQQEVTLGPLDPEASGLRSTKAEIMYFNNNMTSDTKRLILSKYGNEWRGIDRARIVTTDIVTYF